MTTLTLLSLTLFALITAAAVFPRHALARDRAKANPPRLTVAVTSKPPWMSRFAWAVGICETGKGNRYPDFKHRTRDYGGFAGWYHGTWQLDAPKGYPRYPWLATPRQQYRVFLIGRERGRYWGCIENGGYRSWM
jgi:hypothetical protein